jgi:hypothetical protein
MDKDKRPLFGNAGDAEAIMAQATEKVAGQTMSDENLKRAEEARLTQGAVMDRATATGFTEEIINYLNRGWNERDFTPEQRVFSLALATINFREKVPDVFPDGTPGGVEMFDRVCYEAKVYYDENKD